MRTNKKKIGVPSIVMILIFILLVGLGLKGLGFTINHFRDKQPSTTTDKPKTVKAMKSLIYSSADVLSPIGELSDCQIISQKNLFEPLGGRRIEIPKVELVAKSEVKVEPPKPRPEQPNSIALTGIVYINNEYQALIEDSSKGGSSFLKKGGKLKDYTVESITKDKMTLANGDSKITQALGSRTYYDTNGKLLASGSANIQPSTEFTTKSVVESNTSEKDDSNLSLIERMKARRRKELGQE